MLSKERHCFGGLIVILLTRESVPSGCTIIKESLSFTTKFFFTIVHTKLSPTKADNVVTWDRVVMFASLME